MAGPDIDPEQWRTLNRLLDEVLDLPPAERAAWLASLDGENAAFAVQLRDLLAGAAHAATHDPLGTLPGIGPDDLEARTGAVGDRVGHYRLVRELGRGGMGEVWLATRADGLVPRPVALKLPHAVGAVRAGLAERLARERAILGTLDHPHIARLLDAGVTDAGQPFIALEYVDGVAIDRYCAGAGAGGAEALGVTERVELFRQVATAVAYAHANLVIHRDLKPANILVAADGAVKLLDFGIAKLLEDGKATETHLTEIAGRALTLDYASPEQIAGQPLTVASDVYSLGVILFELLAGVRPYRLKRDSRGALEDAILSAEPPRMSEVAPPHLSRQLRGDLDTIVAKALKKSPEERYATANALVDDLTRHLERRPVLARPDSVGYQLRRFVARNRVPVAAAIAVVVAILAGAAAALWQAQRLRVEQARTLAVKDSMISVFEAAEPYAAGGRRLEAAELLRRAYAEQLARPLEDPAVRVEVLSVIASSLVGLEAFDDAGRVAESALQHAAGHLDGDHALVLETRLTRANVLRFRGDSAALQRELGALLPLLRAQADEQPLRLIHGVALAAHAAIDARDFEAALTAAEEAVRLCRAHAARTSRETIDALGTAAVAYSFAGRADAALAAAREAQAAAAEAYAHEPGHPTLIEMRAVLGRALAASGDDRAAAEQYAAAHRGAAQTWGEYSDSAGHYLHSLSKVQLAYGDVRSAIDSASRASRIGGALAGEQSKDFVLRRSVEVRALLAARRGAEAAALAAPMIELEIRYFGPDDVGALETQAAHVLALAESGACPGALAALRRLATVEPAGAGASLARFRRYLVRAARLCDDIPFAIAQLPGAIEATERVSAPVEVAAMRVEHGLVRLAARDAVAAENELRAAIVGMDHAGLASAPLRAEALTGLARIRLFQGNAADARVHAQAAYALWRDFAAESPHAKTAAMLVREIELANARTPAS